MFILILMRILILLKRFFALQVSFLVAIVIDNLRSCFTLPRVSQVPDLRFFG